MITARECKMKKKRQRKQRIAWLSYALIPFYRYRHDSPTLINWDIGDVKQIKNALFTALRDLETQLFIFHLQFLSI